MLTANWIALNCNARGGLPVTGYFYQLTPRVPALDGSDTITGLTTLLTTTISGLDYDKTYHFRVGATTSAGNGPFSAQVAGKTAEAPGKCVAGWDIRLVWGYFQLPTTKA